MRLQEDGKCEVARGLVNGTLQRDGNVRLLEYGKFEVALRLEL